MNFTPYGIRTAILFLLLVVLSCSSSGAGSDPPVDTQEVISFTSTGSVFAPVITVSGSPEIVWTWADGTESNSTTPVKDYGSPGDRINTLHVRPWSSLVRINIGYDGGDGGSSSIEHVDDQQVTSVDGLAVVAPYLRQWCSSYNLITSLDFSNFVHLDTIECFLSHTLSDVTLSNTPSLQRACFEDCNLLHLDLSQSPQLQDLRGALNSYLSIGFAASCSSLWHICIRDNTQITDRHLFSDMSTFPNIEELFIWNDNQTGALVVPSTGMSRTVLIYAHDNFYTSADFSGALQDNSRYAFLLLYRNNLETISLTGCRQVTFLDARNNNLSAEAVDSILATLDELGRPDGTVDLRNNTPPSAVGQLYITNLLAKGWNVDVD